jgi:hypothetical protein
MNESTLLDFDLLVLFFSFSCHTTYYSEARYAYTMPGNRAPSVVDSLYSPILINPQSALDQHNKPPQSPTPPPPIPRLKYPYPLPLLAILDAGYTIHHHLTSAIRPSPHLVALCAVRVVVLAVILGGSRRWRYRGGWVGAGSVLSLGSVVWEACRGRLVRDRERDRQGEGVGIDTTFLVVVSICPVFPFRTSRKRLETAPDN